MIFCKTLDHLIEVATLITWSRKIWEDALDLSWQAHLFEDLRCHFAWQVQHLRRVVLGISSESQCQGCATWWHSPFHTLHFTLHTLQSQFNSSHFTLYTTHFQLYTQHSTLSTLHSTLYTLHFTPHTWYSTPHLTFYTLNPTLYTPCFPLYTPHFTL